MARKKNQKSGKGSNNNKPNVGKGAQVPRGSGKGVVKQSPPNSQTISLGSRFGLKNDGTNGDVTVTGSEIIGVANNASSGRIIFLADLNPVTWASSRIARMIPLYENYRIMSLRVTYIPSCPTTTGGLLYMYYDRDANDPPVGNVSDPSNLSRLMANQNAVAGQVWKPLVMNYKTGPSDQKGYFSAPVNDAGDLRLTSQGMVYAYSSGAPLAVAGGIFKFDYVIKLMTPTGAPLNKASVSPWTYSSFINPSSAPTYPYNPVMDQWTPVVSAQTSLLETVVEVLVELDQLVTMAGTTRTIPAYTPVYYRQLSTIGWVGYLGLSAAIAAGSDYLYNANSALSTSGWLRLLVNLASNLNREN